LLHSGEWEFNAIHPWQYYKLPEVLGGGKGYQVRTEGEFDAALNAAWIDTSGPSILQVQIDPQDCSRALERLAERMAKTVVQK
jgi:indolepyruvate decarboxylase